MDLISSILQALNQNAEQYVMQSKLIPLMREFLEIGDLCIKQYVFALVGDLQKHLGNCFRDQITVFIV